MLYVNCEWTAAVEISEIEKCVINKFEYVDFISMVDSNMHKYQHFELD